MKFSLAFLQANIAMFKAICLSDNLDYIAFYQSNGLYVIAESWSDVQKSTFIIEC
jgi:hypothetical protein